MAPSLRSLFAKPSRPSVPVVPAGYRVYAVGDIHGRRDLLDDCLQQIHADIDRRGPANNVLIFLGDYIDRGPASAEVIERLRRYERHGVRPIFLGGNHEEVLLRLLRGDAQYLTDWLRFGGADCARSYGIDPESLKLMQPARAVAELRTRIPREHQMFLNGLSDTFRIGDYLFVHAGIQPGVQLSEQSQADLRWIRGPFLDHQHDHGFVVVHGHTITDGIDERVNRVGLDTGAYRSGVLTAIGLEGSDRWFIQTAAVPAAPASPDRAGGFASATPTSVVVNGNTG
ncbi:MAG: metallophosphoesterase [Sphingomicrobium sp.]